MPWDACGLFYNGRVLTTETNSRNPIPERPKYLWGMTEGLEYAAEPLSTTDRILMYQDAFRRASRNPCRFISSEMPEPRGESPRSFVSADLPASLRP